MGLQFLDCFTDKDQWDRIIYDASGGSEIGDPHFTSAYYRSFGGGNLAYSIYFSDSTIGQPFRYQNNDWIGNAYNFGGIVLISYAPTFSYYEDTLRKFMNEFGAWKHERKLSERCTVLGITDPLVWPNPKVTPAVIVFLEQRLFDVYSKFRTATKQSIEKAAELGALTTRANPEDAYIFEKIYNESMLAKKAAPHWFYGEGFFKNLLEELGPARSALFLTRVNGVVESGCVLIYYKDKAYYHWAARRGNHSVDAYQIWSVLGWVKAEGIKVLFLGGGKTSDPNDSLLWFKMGFSQTCVDVSKYEIPWHELDRVNKENTRA